MFLRKGPPYVIRGPNVKTKFLEKFGNIGYYYIYNKTIVRYEESNQVN